MSSYYSILIVLFCILLGCNTQNDVKSGIGLHEKTTLRSALSTELWTYIEVDSTKAMWGDFDDPEWLRYFGLGLGDVDGDGDIDIVSGRNVYLNESANLTHWRKEDLGLNVDANLVIGEGNNSYILGESLPDVIRLKRVAQGKYVSSVVAQVPPTGHHNGQGYRVADLVNDGSIEIIYASQGGLYVISPNETDSWEVNLVAADASDEGFAVADMDGDGDLDLIAGYRVKGADAEVPTHLCWFENQGILVTEWPRHDVGSSVNAIDRVEAADFNLDGRMDVAVAEERYPGKEPDANLWVYLQQENNSFNRDTVVTQYSMNNLHAIDLDNDGDSDLITSEHKGDRLALQVWLNDGKANFSESEIDRGKESHLGARAHDIDGDGDLDIVSIGWDKHQYVHLWRNDSNSP